MTDPDKTPILLWLRRDLRLSDHPALAEACGAGRPVIPVFVHDEMVAAAGAAPRWRWARSVASLAAALEDKGSRLILRRGDALPTLRKLVKETGAGAVWWTRLYDAEARRIAEGVKAGLREDGTEARSFPGHVLFEPWTVETGSGGYYKVYTPFWKNVRSRDPGSTCPTPGKVPAPESWPASDKLEEWGMGDAMDRGAAVIEPHATVGESAASHRLGAFMAHGVQDYATARDLPGQEGTSGLSENLTYGEISIRSCWDSGRRAMEEGKKGAETWVGELVWRDFAHHLAFHTPRLTTANWRQDWDAFPWNEDARLKEVRDWKRGVTGMTFVDAAMREMYVTGRMHNRGRMIVASYLTKHLMTHWRIGCDWFADCLIDWDPANNAMGWQWSAGSGPDATPFFRVFNPETQVEKFDKDGAYRRAWIAELSDDPPDTALSYFDAIPRHWAMDPGDAYPDEPLVPAGEGRRRALEAYEKRDF
ncbi:cryptochrome/photolyase family protein [Wenxinia saemankumensis]|uniref:Deoxyribodipyrimidine photo-lyase type I n=1 Tax=Wenxinia saemankumensis TaxID=1447782 RepID=A0A1M6AUK7_9RHOB|nr:deoxyribodipyrimidine photo-lyase [Wenxinia saemankumensis]SHI40117.1 deoxyribodipyrimidine photo-lyase type I [Wenxinia saemankumensis]